MSNQFDDEHQTSAIQTTRDASGMMRVSQNETAAMAVSERQRALVQAKYVIALQRPRDMMVVRQKLLDRCKSKTFASIARYSVPRGGKSISGPSIRFVEEMLRNFGNSSAETVTLYDDQEKRILRCEVVDYETNNSWAKEVTITKTQERKQLAQGQTPLGKRVNSYGEVVYLVPTTEDDLVMKEASAISKAMRGLGLRVLPGDIVEEAQAVVLTTMRNADAEDPGGAIKDLVDKFASAKVNAAMLAEYLGHPVAESTLDEIAELRSIGVAMREGAVRWREVVDAKLVPAPSGSDPKAAEAHAKTVEDVKARVEASVEKAKAQAKAKKGGTASEATQAPEAKPTPKPEAPAAEKPAEPAKDPRGIPGVDFPADDVPAKG